MCCGEIHDDDCIDPRTLFRSERHNKVSHKGLQLCRQAFETLALVLADCDDEIMQSIDIASVKISDDGSRLIATVAMPRSASSDVQLEGYGPEEILSRVSQHIPRLRSELARSICRKRVPNLTFEIDYPSLTNKEHNDD